MAVQEGLLKLDEKVADTITEWKSDPRKSRITYRQLLTLTSGIKGGRSIPPPSYSQAIYAPTIADPGKKFSYGPAPFQIFGEALKRKLKPKGMTVAAYLKKKILDPLGIKNFYWRKYNTGEPYLNAGAYMTARDWAKFGEFLRMKGSFGGKNLLKPDLLKEMFKGTKVNLEYGLTIWLPKRDTVISEGSAIARGAGKQKLYHLPVQGMTIIRFGNTNPPLQFDDYVFIGLLFPFSVDKWNVGVVPASKAAFSLDAGKNLASDSYVILGSLSGTQPGFDYRGFHVPLNQDSFFWYTLGYPNTAPFHSFQGVLDGNGKAKASFSVPYPLPPVFLGLKMYYAFGVLRGASLRFTSNPVKLGFYR